MNLSALDQRVLHLQTNVIEKSTVKGCATRIRDNIRSCLVHNLPLEPTPSTLARYVAYTSIHRLSPKIPHWCPSLPFATSTLILIKTATTPLSRPLFEALMRSA